MLIKFPLRIIGRSQNHSFRSIMGYALIITMMISTSGIISGFSIRIFGLTAKAGESPSIFIQSKDSEGGISPNLIHLLVHTNIDKILPVIERTTHFTSSAKSFNCSFVGLNISKFLSYYINADIYAGRVPNASSILRECMVGKNVYKLAGSSLINITDDYYSANLSLLAVGLVQNVQEFQSSIIIDLSSYYKLVHDNLSEINYNRIKIRLKNRVFVEETISELEEILSPYRDSIEIKPEQQADVFTASIFTDILSKLNLLFGVLFVIALIRVFHTITWFVKKYERDFLIMRAMGLSSLQLSFLVIFLAGIIGNAGFIVGCFFGFLLPSLLVSILTLYFSGSFLLPEFELIAIIPLFLFSNLISILAGLYPAFSLVEKAPSTLSSSTHTQDR
ncbi:MAG: FtsX-like permease family protein [Candidatus Lokiarchaeota archaeon]|nr:FtsX-like permease family protein [Candidatus Lokiarchaeota archaeon]